MRHWRFLASTSVSVPMQLLLGDFVLALSCCFRKKLEEKHRLIHGTFIQPQVIRSALASGATPFHMVA
jgi:hypothetical protein